MRIIKLYLIVFCALFILPYSTGMSYEEANYEVVSKNEVYEIRKYSDRLAVETMTSGIDSNFRKLFNYISGRNDAQEKIKMTTPVTQVEKNGNMSMQFYLPSKFNSENVSSELSHPIKGLVPGSSVIYSIIHLSNFFNPDCIAVLEGL